MPEKETLERAREDEKEGKSPSTQAGEFVREEIEHVREGKHGARSPQQAIAIGLSKARRAGIRLPPPKKGRASGAVRKRAARDLRKGRASSSSPSPKRSHAVRKALKRESKGSVSGVALSSQARRSARQRGSSARKNSARRAVRTQGIQGLRKAARKAAQTPQGHAVRR